MLAHLESLYDGVHYFLVPLAEEDNPARIPVVKYAVVVRPQCYGSGKPAGDINHHKRYPHSRGQTHYPTSPLLQALFERRKVSDGLHLPVADNDVRFSIQNGGNQTWDVGLWVLIISIGINDNVGAQFQACVKSSLKANSQTLMPWQTYDVVDPHPACHFHRLVGAAVVNDQSLDNVDARDGGRHIDQGSWQTLFFVVTRNLDNEVHSSRAITKLMLDCSMVIAGEQELKRPCSRVQFVLT